MQSYSLRVEGARTIATRAEVAPPVPGRGQLLLRVRAAGLNRGEFIPGGLTAKAGASKPAGLEAAGEVVALGEGVAGWQVGQRVMGRCPGAFAEFAAMDAREAMPMPERLSFEEAAAVPLVFLVVHDMLLQGRLRAGTWLLITGVSSGVGVAALQTAKALGAQVIGTSGSAAKLQRLLSLGLDVALHTRQPDFHDAVMQASAGHGADLVVNTVGGSLFAECVRSMAFEGRLATVGYVDRTLKAEIDLQALHAKRLTLFGVSNKLRSPEQRAAGVPAFVTELLPLLADGRIRPLLDHVFAFTELAAAQSRMEADLHLGKLVLAGTPDSH